MHQATVWGILSVPSILAIFPGPALREDLIEAILKLGKVGRSGGWGDHSVGMVIRQLGKIIW